MKKAVLLIGRGSIFEHVIQGMINRFSIDFEVLVIDNPRIKYHGNHTRIDVDFHATIEVIDWQQIHRIEKELGLNLYESYSNYFYYGRLAQEANIKYTNYWRSKEKLGTVFLNSYHTFKELIRSYNICFAFHDTIDQIWTQVLESMSKKHGFGFYHTLIKPGIFNNRVIPSCTIPRISPLFYHHFENFTPKKEEETLVLAEVFQKFGEQKPQMSYLKNRGQSILNWAEAKKIWKNRKNIFFGIKRLLNRVWLHKISRSFDIDKSGEYILYFMAHQPEASTTSAAQKYVDQWKIIEDLAINAPSNLNIVIKDHPFGYGWRGRAYYERLVRLPNVQMAPIGYDGKLLIKRAKTVLTINGSIGLEAMIYDTPAFTLGQAWYSHPGYIENLESHLDILSRLDKLTALTMEEKERVLLSAYRSSVDFFVSFEPGNEDKKIQAGENLADHFLFHQDVFFKRGIV